LTCQRDSNNATKTQPEFAFLPHIRQRKKAVFPIFFAVIAENSSLAGAGKAQIYKKTGQIALAGS